MHKVSVIIPVYNVEKYLPKCLDSVINQTYKDLEIICVNDCSPDNSIAILEAYAQKDNRIKIINCKHNGGLSAARNTGLDLASGEYIYFLDSDDWIDINYIEIMLNTAIDKGMDIILNTNILAEYDTETKPEIWPYYQQKLPQGEFLDSVKAVNDTQYMVWAHLYKKSFLDKHHLRFPEGFIHEDVYFQYVSKIHTKQLFAFYGPAYHYRKRNDSIMAHGNQIIGLAEIFKLTYKYYQKNNLLDYDVKFIVPLTICQFDTEEEFQKTKQLFNDLSDHLKQKINIYNNYEQFIIESVSKSQTIDEYFKITKNNTLVIQKIIVYDLRKKLKKNGENE